MDVDCYSFQTLLPSILAAISSSRFVSVDLELSGIPSRHRIRGRRSECNAGGKATLQQRYTEIKAAAERFQILQLGLTCVEEVDKEGVYIIRPYNLHISPLVDKKLKIERDVTFQNGAVDFLLAHHFSMETPFVRGVPYLSWEEEADARAIAAREWDKEDFADISIQLGDTENLLLMKRVREEIADWRQQTPQPNYLNITAAAAVSPDNHGKGFNRYQKRLIHQLIRAEHADLVSISREDFIQLLPFDQEREKVQQSRRSKGLERTLTHQKGLRWVIEALCKDIKAGFPPQHTSPISSAKMSHGLLIAQPTSDKFITDSHPAQETASAHDRPTLVGHNLFLDLVYLYACFFGQLPDRVQDFSSRISILFPRVCDTKYVADIIQHNSPSYNSSLEDIDYELSKNPSPAIDIPPGFDKYAGSPNFHEAGYDSFIAARALIRLSAKLEGREVLCEKPPSIINLDGQVSPKSHPVALAAEQRQSSGGALSSSKSPPEQKSSSSNMFESLSLKDHSVSPATQEPRLMMPSDSSQFWSTYGNSLRVNGTIEEFCKI